MGAPEAYRSVINEERWQCENSKVNERDAIIAMSRPWNTGGQKSKVSYQILTRIINHKKATTTHKVDQEGRMYQNKQQIKEYFVFS